MVSQFKKYPEPDDSGYGSHIDALEFIFGVTHFDNAIELGMGFFSTGFLLTHVKESLISMEMQEREWYEKVVAYYQASAKINWQPVIFLSKGGYDKIDTQGVTFALSDGHGDSRPDAVNYWMAKGVETIVGHDTESSWYGWHRVMAEQYGYFEYTFKQKAPYTTLWTKNNLLIQAVKAEFLSSPNSQGLVM